MGDPDSDARPSSNFCSEKDLFESSIFRTNVNDYESLERLPLLTVTILKFTQAGTGGRIFWFILSINSSRAVVVAQLVERSLPTPEICGSNTTPIVH